MVSLVIGSWFGASCAKVSLAIKRSCRETKITLVRGGGGRGRGHTVWLYGFMHREV